jgi:hypothetical protein
MSEQPAAVYDTRQGNFGDRLSREVRLTWHEASRSAGAIRRRIRELDRKIETARGSHRAGNTIQHGRLAEHEAERESLRNVLSYLDAAEDALSREACRIIRET